MGRVGAVLLAAGAGRRFGGTKPLAPFRGRPLLSHACEAIARARGTGLLAAAWAVVAVDDEPARSLVVGAGLTPIANDRPGDGISHSIRLGLKDGLADLLPAPALIDVPGANPDVDTPTDLHRLEEPRP